LVDELEDIQREILYVFRSLYVYTRVSSIPFPEERSISIFRRTVVFFSIGEEGMISEIS
jgi:hypothetical protein